MNQFFFELYTLEGRIGRFSFFSKIFMLAIILGSVFFAYENVSPYLRKIIGADNISPVKLIFIGFSLLLTAFPYFALSVRRLHDVGISGFLLTLLILLVIAFNVFNILHSNSSERIDTSVKVTLSVFTILTAVLSLWPAEKGRNAYGLGRGVNPVDLTYDPHKERLKHGFKKKQYRVIIKDPIDEDSLYIFKNLKSEYQEIVKIHVSSDRRKVDFDIYASSSFKKKDIRNILKSYGYKILAVRDRA